MYFKLLAITVIIGIISHEAYSEKCCCSEKCQKNNDKNRDDRSDSGAKDHNTSLCTSSSLCSIPNQPRQKHLKLASYPTLSGGGVLSPMGKHYLQEITCPPPRCPPSPQCPEKVCPPSKLCPRKFCPLPPPCPIKVCPPSCPCTKLVCSIIPPSPSSYPRKLYPLPPSPYLSVARGPELNSYDFKKTDGRREEGERKKAQYFGTKYDTNREYTNVKSNIANFPREEIYHSIVKRLANTSSELSLNSDEINNTESPCNNERLREIITAYIDSDPKLSKELIQLAAQKEFNKNFNVICSNDTFAYSTYSDTFCEVNGEMITCYAFKAG